MKKYGAVSNLSNWQTGKLFFLNDIGGKTNKDNFYNNIFILMFISVVKYRKSETKFSSELRL